MNKNNNFSRLIQEKRRSLSSKNKRVPTTSRRKKSHTDNHWTSIMDASTTSYRNAAATRRGHSVRGGTSTLSAARPPRESGNSSRSATRGGQTRRSGWKRHANRSHNAARAFWYCVLHLEQDWPGFFQAHRVNFQGHCAGVGEHRVAQQACH